MPLVYPDDPDDADEVPRGSDLGYVEIADVSVHHDDAYDKYALAEEEWADEDGICRAWLAIDGHAFIEDVSLYA